MPLVAFVTLLLAAPVWTGSPEQLRDLAASGQLRELNHPDFSKLQASVQSFYEASDYSPAWTDNGALTPATKAILQILQSADAKGLDPEDYGASRLPSLAAVNPVRFDLALTISLMRYISDLHFGRVNPRIFDTAFDLDSDLASFVRSLIHAPGVEAALDAVEPPFDGYRRTEKALDRYLIVARDAPPITLPPAKKPIDPGSAYPEASQLAALVRQLGDLPPDATLPPDPNLYAGALVDAVKRFQARHGLESDGRIGPATLRELNTPVSQRIRQLQLSLERWRWVPHSFPNPPIVVNIPEFQLRALDGAYHTALEMKVVVGKAFGHQTPVFTAEMTHIIFRPYWEVPFSIQYKELIPKLEKDPSDLAKEHFEIVNARKEVVSNGPIEQDLLGRLRSGELRLRQTPGPENSLGLVKFVFPNPYDVYMHATPAKELFSRTRRDFSHGCIRVEKPVELAKWLLRDQPEWTPDRIEAAMNGSATLRVDLKQPIPVLIVYATAVVPANGEVHFFDDIYGLDAQLERLLATRWERPGATTAAPGLRPRG